MINRCLCSYIFCLLLAMASFAEDARYPIKIVDALGKEVIIAEEPQRIVVAGTPLYTEILIDLEAQHKIVGVAESADNPLQIRDTETVGTSLRPNLEKIVSLRPQLVFGLSTQYRSKIESVGIPVFLAGKPPYGIIDSIDEVYKTIRAIDQIVHGNTDHSEIIITNSRKKMGQIIQTIKARSAPIQVAVLYAAKDRPPYAIGKNSIESELLRLAGAKNVFGHSGPIGLEALVQRDPQIIFTDPAQVGVLTSNAKLKILRAVRNDKVYGIPSSQWTSSRIANTLELVVEYLQR